MNEQGFRPGETVPFTRESDAFNFVRAELAKGRSVTIWPVEDEAHILAAISTEQRKFDRKLAMTYTERLPAHTEWRRFDGAEEWLADRVLWAWNPAWSGPRLITAGQGDEFEWFLECGPKLEEHTEGYPTHCCDPLPPMPPAMAPRGKQHNGDQANEAMIQSSLDKRELQTIRFLGFWAKQLVFAIRTGKCSVTVLGHVEQCCERIKDMAEYAHEDAPIEQREHELASNVRFMKDLSALDLGVQNVVGYLPGEQDLERLLVTHNTKA